MALVLVALAGPAVADNKDVARDAFREGSRQYEIGDFKAALAAFKKAYLSYEDPAFLFNIAQCERQLGDKVEAVRTYRVFLRKVPNSPQRESVERIVGELQQAIEQEKTAATRPPTGTIEPGAATAAPPAAAPSASEAARPAAPASGSEPATAGTSLSVAAAPPPASRPLHKRPWFWVVVGGAAVVVATGVALGVTLGSSPKNPTPTYGVANGN